MESGSEEFPPGDLSEALLVGQDVEGGVGPESTRPAGQPTNQRIAVLATALMPFAMAMESLWVVFGESVIKQTVQEVLDLAQKYFKDKYGVDLPDEEKKKRNPHELDLDQIAAILMYTMQLLYGELNKRLRSDWSGLQPFLPYLKLFLTALYKLPTRKMKLYRGIKRVDLDDLVDWEVGAGVTTFWAFTSTTCKLSVLNSDTFLGQDGKRIAFYIIGRGTDISLYSRYPEESEFLIEAGATFQVGEILDCGHDLEMVEMEEIVDSQENSQSCFDFAPPEDRIHLELQEKQEEKEENKELARLLVAQQDALRRWKLVCKIVFVTAIACTTICFMVFHQVFIRDAGSDWDGTFPELSVSVSAPAAVNGSNGAHDNYAIWVLGGYIFNETTHTTHPSNQVQVLDRNRTSWSIHSRMPMELGSHAAVWWNNCLVVTGGFLSSAQRSNHVLRMCNTNTIEWEMWKPMNFARAGHSSIIYQDKIYVLGGDHQGRNQVEYFDPDADEWQTQTAMREGRTRYFASVVYKGWLFALGGATLSVEYFNGSTWTETTPMLVTAHSTGINAVVFDEKIYVFGSSVVEQGRWIGSRNALVWYMQRQATSLWLPGQLYMAGCVRHENQYWAMGGGYRDSPPSNQTWAIYLDKLNPNPIYAFFYSPWE